MQVKGWQNLVAILAIAFVVALPTAAADPTIDLKVNGVDVAFQGAPAFDPDFGFWSSSLVASGAGWSLTGDIIFGELPGEKAFIDYFSLHAVAGDDITSFTLKLTFPFVNGPYTTLTSGHASTIKDGGNSEPFPGVQVTPNDFSFIHTALLDNAVVADAQISQGCLDSGIAGFSAICQKDQPLLSQPVSTASNGVLGAVISFKLSPHDSFMPNGSVELVGSVVPEPAAYFSLLAGLLGVFGVIARRRIRELDAA